MRTLLVVAVLVAGVAAADSLVTTWVNGAGIQTYQGAANAKVSFQCPHLAVFWRPGGCSGCAVDAGCAADGGMCDFVADFNFNPDPVGPLFIAPNMSKIHFKNVDGGTVACGVARENP